MFPDWSLIANEIIALSVVLAPIEVGVLLTLTRFKQLFLEMKSNAELKVDKAFTFFDTAKGAFDELSKVVIGYARQFGDPLFRERLVSEAGHGLFRVLKERQGSLKGIAAREIKSQLLEGGDLEGILDMAGGKIELPVVGKVSPGQALQLLKKGRGLLAGAGSGGSTSSSSSESGQPP